MNGGSPSLTRRSGASANGTSTLPGTALRWKRKSCQLLLWYPAAGLLSELKFLAAPATLGAPTLSADVEDHSTLAPLALQLLERSVDAAEKLFAIEALTAAYLLVEVEATAARPLGRGQAPSSSAFPACWRGTCRPPRWWMRHALH